MATIINTFTDTIAITYTGNGKAVSTPVGSYTGTEDAGVSTVVTAATTNQAISISFPHATIKALVMSCDQDVTVKMNSTTTPTETFSIKKTSGLVWGVDYATACPFLTDVTAIYVTNAGSTDAKFNLRVLYA
jgi:hypothetical protein